jgi:DNA-directed RNA polymerase specialized sigma24 family protein
MSDYVRFSELAFLLVRDPVVAEVVAVDAVLAARRRALSPDAPPPLNRARRKLVQHALGYVRRRRIAQLLPWARKRAHGLQLSESTQRVWDAVGALRPVQQAAVILARVEGANLAEIADALEFSGSAANAHLDRARDALRRKLGTDVDLRALLTRELNAVARTFTRTYRPDPETVEPLFRAGRWRTWTVTLGVVAVAAAAAVSFVRG